MMPRDRQKSLASTVSSHPSSNSKTRTPAPSLSPAPTEDGFQIGREIEEIADRRYLPNFDPPKSPQDPMPSSDTRSRTRTAGPTERTSAKDPSFLRDISTIFSRGSEQRSRKNDIAGATKGGSGRGLFNRIYLRFGGKRKKKGKVEDEKDMTKYISDLDREFEESEGVNCRKFSFQQLATATDNFSGRRILGEGGFGAVYKGFLSDIDVDVAIKRLSKYSSQGMKEFISEVRVISRLDHPNLVKLLGWCHERNELMLVYEFVGNGNLASHLYGPHAARNLLSWENRYKILVGLATALRHLHEELDQCVIHRDVKPSNIMLDSDFNTKLTDFGLAKHFDRGDHTSVVVGTMGYLDPEYIFTGKSGKEGDVYGFGVVTLEIICGRRPVENNLARDQSNLIQWITKLLGAGEDLVKAADKRLALGYNTEEAKRVKKLMVLGLACVAFEAKSRPSMGHVVKTLLRGAKKGLNGAATCAEPGSLHNLNGNSFPGPSNVENNANSENWTPSAAHSQDGTYVSGLGTPPMPLLAGSTSVEEIPEVIWLQSSGNDHTAEENTSPLERWYRSLSNSNLGHHNIDETVSPDPRSGSSLDYDLDVPPTSVSIGQSEARQKPIIEDALTSLSEIFGTVFDRPDQLDTTTESLATYTAMLVAARTPLDQWNVLAQYALQAAEEIDQLQRQLQDEEAEVLNSTESIQYLREEEARSKQVFDDNWSQNQLYLEKKIADLAQQFGDLQQQLKNALEACLSIGKESKLIKQRRDRQIRTLDRETAHINSITENLEIKKRDREKTREAIFKISSAVLSRISSFSIG